MSCNNVNTTGSTTPSSADIDFYLAVAKGDFTGYTKVNKFGYNDSIGSGAFEVIWETGGQYPYQSTAVTVDVVSDDVNDDVIFMMSKSVKKVLFFMMSKKGPKMTIFHDFDDFDDLQDDLDIEDYDNLDFDENWN